MTKVLRRIRLLEYGRASRNASTGLAWDFMGPHGPRSGHPLLDPPGYATLRGRGPEQRLSALEDSEADDCWRTKRSNGHVMRSCKGLCARGLSRVWGFGRLGKDAAIQTAQQRYSFEYSRCRPCRRSVKRTAIFDRSSGVFRSWIVWSVSSLCFESRADQPSGIGAQAAPSSIQGNDTRVVIQTQGGHNRAQG